MLTAQCKSRSSVHQWHDLAEATTQIGCVQAEPPRTSSTSSTRKPL